MGKGLFDATRDNVQLWHYDRKIIENGNSNTQFLKLLEEVTELGKAIDLEDRTELIDAIGDIMVVLSSISDMEDIDMAEAFESAYQEIKDRTGHLNKNGDFIKDDDLPEQDEYKTNAERWMEDKEFPTSGFGANKKGE